MNVFRVAIAAILGMLTFPCWAEGTESGGATFNLTHDWIGYASVAIFVIAYILVMLEDQIQLRKSKPVLLAAGVIWILLGIAYHALGQPEVAKDALEGNFLEYAELLLFLLVAMTYINAMEERRLFDALQTWMVSKGFSFRTLFWMTGFLTFFISPVADNLTTALLMCTVVLKVAGKNNAKFINLACINIVVAANAGGAFSPFGDITTLMVWQAGKVSFGNFFSLFIPALANYLIPALIMCMFVPKTCPPPATEATHTKRGAKRIVALFVSTILTAVILHAELDFPPVVGMMLGLAYLQFFGFFLKKTAPKFIGKLSERARAEGDTETLQKLSSVVPFDVFKPIARAEWDTLLFFYGVVMCVGGLSLLGYLHLVSNVMYVNWNPIWANVVIGCLSSIVDNIPVMFAVIQMDPTMHVGNWLLVTLTAGVGGSLLSIGSAAGVALMGAARGQYTFVTHLKWFPAIALGYAGSIVIHLLYNAALFQ